MKSIVILTNPASFPSWRFNSLQTLSERPATRSRMARREERPLGETGGVLRRGGRR